MFVDKFAIFSLNRLSVGIADLTLHTSTNKDQISIRQELLRVVVWESKDKVLHKCTKVFTDIHRNMSKKIHF